MSFTSMMFTNRRRTIHTNALNSFQRVFVSHILTTQNYFVVFFLAQELTIFL